MGHLSPWQLALLSASLVCFAVGASPASVSSATSFAKRFSKRLSPLETLDDFKMQSLLMLFVYILQYLALGGVFEGTNPKHYLRSLPADAAAKERAEAQAVVDKRREQVYHEMRAGVLSLVITVGLAVLWMYVGEPRTAFYGFFATREWSPWWAVGGVAAYVASFDTWFYWSHFALHEIDWVWHSIHFFHHQYKEPSAFAQFAVHPVEAALQGPVGHFLVQLWFPVHPVQLAVMGFLSSAWAFAAHDGRWGDFNSHYFHHSKGRGRKHYFNLGFLTPTWDVIMGTRWHENHPLWLEWKAAERKGTAKDTRDGSLGGVPNTAWLSVSATEGKIVLPDAAPAGMKKRERRAH